MVKRAASRGWCLGGIALAALLGGGDAWADWPMARHDARRSAVADGSTTMSSPVPYWRFYAGGTLSSAGLIAFQAADEVAPNVLVASGGRVRSHRPESGDLVWESPNLEIQVVVGLVDLDGAGEPELVVRSSRQVFVLSPSTGALLWAEPVGEMGTIGGVRLSDLDGDGVDDLIIAECGCCSVNSGNGGFAYSFAGAGGLGAPTLLWQLPSIGCGGGRPAALVRMRSPAQLELVHAPNNNELRLIDAAALTELATLPTFGPNSVVSHCEPIDVGASPGEELLCIYNNSQAPAGEGRQVLLLDWVGGDVTTLWARPVAEVDGSLELPARAVADLDGDGTLEIVVSGQLESGDWATYVLDAETGLDEGVALGHRASGTVATLPGTELLLTVSGDDLFAFTLAPGGLSPAWILPERRPLTMSDYRGMRRAQASSKLVAFDFDGDGRRDLVTTNVTDASDVRVHDLGGAAPTTLANYALPAETSVRSAWALETGSTERLAVMQSDGNLHLFDTSLAPLSGNPSFGVRVGGYYASGTWRQLATTPVMADLRDGGPPGLLVGTSRGSLARIDARDATFAGSAPKVWERLHTTGATIAKPPGASERAVFAIDVEDPDRHGVVALRPSGETLWAQPLAGVTLAPLVVGSVDGDGFPDVFVQWGLRTDFIEENRCLSGATGGVIWDAPPIGPHNRQLAGAAAADWNGDGVDDLIHQAVYTRVRNGLDGSELVAGGEGPSRPYYMPLVDDVDGDGEDEVTMHGGFSPAFTLTHDLQDVLWEGTEDDRPLTYATMARCPGRPPLLVGGSWQFPARVKLTETAGPRAGSFETRVLAGGQMFLTQEAADAAGVYSGQLGSPTLHPSLDGNGRAVAVVGSTDGWLYAFDPCSLELVFTHDFQAPVGAAIFGDGDGDGLDEIIVSVADGYLYGLRDAPLASPEWVIDTDPPRGILDEDVDTIRTEDTLYLAWEPVADAVGYQVAIVRDLVDGGEFITTGPWIDVGAVTSAAVPALPLEDGRRYFAAVRAYAQGGVSPDVISDGVTVLLESPPKKSESSPEPVWLGGRSCVYFCAAAAGENHYGGAIAAAGLGLLIARRRRR